MIWNLILQPTANDVRTWSLCPAIRLFTPDCWVNLIFDILIKVLSKLKFKILQGLLSDSHPKVSYRKLERLKLEPIAILSFADVTDPQIQLAPLPMKPINNRKIHHCFKMRKNMTKHLIKLAKKSKSKKFHFLCMLLTIIALLTFLRRLFKTNLKLN